MEEDGNNMNQKTKQILIFIGLKLGEIGIAAVVIGFVIGSAFFAEDFHGYFSSCPYFWPLFISYYALYLFLTLGICFMAFFIIVGSFLVLKDWIKINWEKAGRMSRGLDKHGYQIKKG